MKKIFLFISVHIFFNPSLLYVMESPNNLSEICEAEKKEVQEEFKNKIKYYRQFRRYTNQDLFIDAHFPRDIELIRPYEYIDLAYRLITQKVITSDREKTFEYILKRKELLDENEKSVLDFFIKVQDSLPADQTISALAMLYEYILPPSTDLVSYPTKSSAARWLLTKNPLLKDSIFSIVTIQHLVFKFFSYDIIPSMHLLLNAGAGLRSPLPFLPKTKKIGNDQKKIFDNFAHKNTVEILRALCFSYATVFAINEDEVLKIIVLIDQALGAE